MRSNAYVDMHYFLSTSQENKIDDFFFAQSSILDRMSITISCELGEKGNFLAGGSKFCVGL